MRILCAIAVLTSTLPLLAQPPSPPSSWRQEVDSAVGRLGHRNMIIVADSAYPIQTGSGIKVVVTAADHVDVLQHVIAAIDRSPAVRPLIAIDKEFAFVPEEYARGAAELRQSVLSVLEGKSASPIRELLHEDLLREVDDLASQFQVVVFKTTGTIAYSSVFVTLDCGYWSSEAEKALREIVPKGE